MGSCPAVVLRAVHPSGLCPLTQNSCLLLQYTYSESLALFNLFIPLNLITLVNTRTRFMPNNIVNECRDGVVIFVKNSDNVAISANETRLADINNVISYQFDKKAVYFVESHVFDWTSGETLTLTGEPTSQNSHLLLPLLLNSIQKVHLAFQEHGF